MQRTMLLTGLIAKLRTRSATALAGLVLLAWVFFFLYINLRTRPVHLDACPITPVYDSLAELGRPPDPHHAHQLGSLWLDLTTIFHAHPPSPRRLLRPTLGRPSDINTFTIHDADNALGLTGDQAKRTRRAHRRILSELPKLDAVASPPWQGKGIVILAGGRYSHIAMTTTAILRLYHHSRLPVEIWIGNDGADEDWIEEMRRMGVSVRWLTDYAQLGSMEDWWNPFRWLDERPWSPYQWKLMALFFSSFEEVLFLDADSVPGSDPEYLFDTEQYQSTGAVIWPDYWQSISSSSLPYLVGMSETPSDLLWHRQTAEAGQMLWHKRKHWKSLLLACYYNYYGPSFWFTASIGNGPGWGDKDIYLLALKATGEDYSMVFDWMDSVKARNTSIGVLNIQYQPRIGNISIPAFYHGAGGYKWSLDEFMTVKRRQSNLWAYIKSTIFWHKSATLALLLQQDGRLFEMRDWRAADPEVLLWAGLQHVACWSSLGSEEACVWVRGRMSASLGVESVGIGSVYSC